MPQLPRGRIFPILNCTRGLNQRRASLWTNPEARMTIGIPPTLYGQWEIPSAYCTLQYILLSTGAKLLNSPDNICNFIGQGLICELWGAIKKLVFQIATARYQARMTGNSTWLSGLEWFQPNKSAAQNVTRRKDLGKRNGTDPSILKKEQTGKYSLFWRPFGGASSVTKAP